MKDQLWEEKWDDFSKEEIRKELKEEFDNKAAERQAAYQRMMASQEDLPRDDANPDVIDRAECRFCVPGQDNAWHKIEIRCTKHFVSGDLYKMIEAAFPGARVGSLSQSSERVSK